MTENAEKIDNSESSAAPCAARDAQTPIIAPDLTALIEAWADLPEAVRRGILAMVEAAKGEGP